jgi:ABC-type sulfate transport system permease subunit
MVIDFLANPAFPRAIVVGVLGGAGLSLTIVFSRRGPMIFVPYAALLAALTLLLSRYADLSYASRFIAALSGFVVATAAAYITVSFMAKRRRDVLRKEGRLPATVLGPSLWQRTWHVSLVLGLCGVASAAVAFVSS